MKTPPPAAPAAGPPTWPPSAPPSSRPSKTPATCTSPKAGATTPPQPKPSTFTASIKTETDIHGTRRSPEATPPTAAATWDLSQLIHQVGLPVAAHAGPGTGFALQVLEWSLVYGVGIIPHV